MKSKSPPSEEGETFSPIPAKSSGQSPPRASSAASSKPVEAITDFFDPFGLGDAASTVESKVDEEDSSTASPKPPPRLMRLKMSKTPPAKSPSPRRMSSPLPPRIVVKLGLHEEVSSIAKAGPDSEGASDVSVEGTVYVSLFQARDAKFWLEARVSYVLCVFKLLL